MFNSDEQRQFEEQNRRWADGLRQTIGDSWRKPIAARLGYQAEDGVTYVPVESERTDEAFKYYFSEAGGTSFQGEAFLLSGALEKWQIVYGAPILIRRNVLNSEWEITGIDSRWAAQFFDGVDQDDGVIITYPKVGMGLLTQASPPSMKALVLSGAYRYGQVTRIYETQSTVDWGVAPYNSYVPAINLKQRYVLVQIDFATGLLGYKYGSEIASAVTPMQAYQANIALGDDSILPAVDSGYFRSGYVRLTKGMTRITKANLWPLQDYLILGGSGPNEVANVLDKIVTSGGEVVVDSLTGNVVYIT